MFLFDTDIIIWILRDRSDVVDITTKIIKDQNVEISTITIAEVYQHIFPKEIPKAEDTLFLFESLPVTSNIARNGGFYWQEYHTRLRALSITDCLIAATAKEYNLSLLTLNIRHFPMSDIRIYDPLKKLRNN